MNNSKAVCPQCKQEVQFERQKGMARCPLCAFQYELNEAPPVIGPGFQSDDSAGNPFLKLLRIAVISVLVMLGVGALLLGVLFAGCMFTGKMKF
jgi:hypothetical protein